MENLNSLPASVLTKSQKQKHVKQGIMYDGIKADIVVTIRYDDDCNNGHNSFAITGNIYEAGKRTERAYIAGGCIHDEIEKYFPEYAHLIQWHLVSSDGPMYYLENTLYHASARDHNGLLAGEVRTYETRARFGDFPISVKLPEKFLKWCAELETYDLEVMALYHDKDPAMYGAKYTIGGYPGAEKWHQCPFDTEADALGFLQALQNYPLSLVKIPVSYSDGKTPNYDAARRCAVWPEASPDDFTREKLIARLPELMQRFKADVEALGFTY